jgi:hypothetical protein
MVSSEVPAELIADHFYHPEVGLGRTFSEAGTIRVHDLATVVARRS